MSDKEDIGKSKELIEREVQKVAKQLFKLTISLAPVIMGLSFYLGFYLSSITKVDEVNPEYINGILAASSILFGFWTTMLSKNNKPKTVMRIQTWSFVLGVIDLSFSVLLISISAVNPSYSLFALVMINQSFFCILMLIFFSKIYEYMIAIELNKEVTT